MNPINNSEERESAKELYQAIEDAIAFVDKYSKEIEHHYVEDGVKKVDYELPRGLKADQIEEFKKLDTNIITLIRKLGMPPPLIGRPMKQDEKFIGLTGLKVTNLDGIRSLPHEQNVILENRDWQNYMDFLLRQAEGLVTAAPVLEQDYETGSGYLGLVVNEVDRVVARNGKEANFDRSSKAWKLFHDLFVAEEQGKSTGDLMNAVWPGQARQDNNLEQQKRKTNLLLNPLGVKIEADNRGIWRLSLIEES